MSLVKSVEKGPELPVSDRRQWLWAFLSARETRQSYALTCIALWSLCFYLIITNFVGGTIEVDGISMVPTLRHGETYILNRWTYHFRPPHPGEIVVLRDPGYTDFAIKRVVAVEGDHLEFRDAAVYLNGQRLKEPYVLPDSLTFPVKERGGVFDIPPNHFFVLGDNRENSLDSRHYGPLHRQHIIGLLSFSDQ